jgi:tetratricopeptide (TPR) repeat protein
MPPFHRSPEAGLESQKMKSSMATLGMVLWLAWGAAAAAPGSAQQPVGTPPAAGQPPGAPPAPAAASDPGLQPGQSLKQEQVSALYKQALAAWAGGDVERACGSLMALEKAAVKDGDAKSRKRLLQAEEAVIHSLAGENLEVLVPIAQFHYEVYRRYLGPGPRGGYTIVLAHARTMVHDLAIIYQEQSGSEGASRVASRLLTALGELMERAALHQPAAELFNKAAELDPRNTAAGLSLALIYEKNEQYDGVVKTLRRVLEAEPGQPEARLRLAINLKRLNRRDEGKKLLEGLAAAGDDRSWVANVAFQELAEMESEAGAYGKAEAVLKAALARFPQSTRLHVQLAAVLDRKGDLRASKTMLENVLSLPPGSDDTSRFRYNSVSPDTFAAARSFVAENARSRMAALAQALGVAAGSGGAG